MADQIPPSERRRILGILTKRKLPKPPKPPPPSPWVAIRVGTMDEYPAPAGQGKANYTPPGAEENTMSDKKLPPPSPAQQKAVCEVGERVLKEPPPKPEKK